MRFVQSTLADLVNCIALIEISIVADSQQHDCQFGTVQVNNVTS